MKKNNIPALRFPQFNEPWAVKKLGEVGDVRDGTHDSPKYTTDGYPFITSKNLMDDGCISFENINYISKEDFDKFNKRSKVDKGDILLAMIGTIGNPVIVTSSGFAIKNVALIKKSEKIINRFLFQILKSESTIRAYSYLNVGNTQKFIALGQIRSLPISLPTLPEQQKIADFLSGVDEKIGQLERRLALEEQYKKGMMQRLFDQEIRFKDDNGNEFPDWEEKKFDHFFNVGSSKRVLQENWTSEGVAFYRTRELVSKSKGEAFRSEIFISKELYEELSSRYGVPTEGDFLVSGVGTLGICYQVKSNDRFYFKDGNVLWFKLMNNELYSLFFYYCFQTDFIQNQITGQASKSTVGTYTIQNAKKTALPYPTLPEQQKIADFLSSLDDKIGQTKAELEKARVWKRGLMQRMFV